MKGFVEKLISRLEEEVIALEDNYGDEVECIPSNVVFEIINELAEEYSANTPQKSAEEYKVSEMPTGWIPCSERLPKVNGWYLVTNTLGVVQQQHWGASHWQKLMDEAVIAWMPLPAPYKKVGD